MGVEGGNRFYSFSQFFDSRDPGTEVSFDVPDIFQDIGVVYAVTHNSNKFFAIKRWVDSHGIIRGGEPLETHTVSAPGLEPDWSDAFRVALHKTDLGVKALQGKPGPQALVVGSDVVVWMNGVPKHNLSRVENLTGRRLQQEVWALQDMFSRPSTIAWDVAIGISRKGLRAGTGHRISVQYNPIPERLIAEIFSEDIAGALGRNTRLPLIDDPRLTQYVVASRKVALRSLVTADGVLRDDQRNPNGEEKSRTPFTFANKQILHEYKDEIVGGFVGGRVLSLLEKQNANSRQPQTLLLI